ncbi:hypothetical protein ZWY2020_018616 [Hordeum vulgare]|nr:hypothetical protein ZWY2020_018616 [Hordeum vulgare]
MPALMAKRSSSGLCAIRRELQQRRKLAGAGTAPKGGIAKKSSACALIQKKPSSASILQHAPVAVADKKQQLDGGSKGTSAAAKEIASVPLGQVAKRCTAPTRRSASIPPASSGADTTTGAEYIKTMPTTGTRSRPSSIWAKKGMSVKVRTRAGILPTGHCLVLWLGARVVSDAAAYNDGYVEVIYDGNFPRDDPLRTVRVAMDDVRSMPDIAES